jgi:hypothetical protein
LFIQAYLLSRWVWQKRVNINKVLSHEPKKPMTQEELYKQGLELVKMFGGDTGG